MTDEELAVLLDELAESMHELTQAVKRVIWVLPKLSDAVLALHARTVENEKTLKKLQAQETLIGEVKGA